jgi:hypothetical protein
MVVKEACRPTKTQKQQRRLVIMSVKHLQDIGVTVELPVIFYCDNVGAIFMAENATATAWTKHVDAQYHFVREHIIDEFVKVVFVKSEDNKADMFTKNVANDLYEKHKGNYIIKREDIDMIGASEGRALASER